MDDEVIHIRHGALPPDGPRCARCGAATPTIVAITADGRRRGLCGRCAEDRAALRALVRWAAIAPCPPLAPDLTPVETWLHL